MSKTVVVTGATGYVAGQIVKDLVAKGYNVRCTVRDPTNKEKVAPLTELGEKVSLFKADLLEEGSFDQVCEGVDGVFHVASPFNLTTPNPQEDVIDPALKGTKNVLGSIAKNKVKVLVVTSSMAAVAKTIQRPDEKVWTEEDWNTDASLTVSPYSYSKVLAEKAVWEWEKDHKETRVAVINPSFVLGPIVSTSKGVSVTSIKTMLNGDDAALPNVNRALLIPTGLFPFSFGHVDIRNVSEAHIAAFEKDVTGRFPCTSTESYSALDRHNIMREIGYGHYPLATKQDGPIGPKRHFNRDRAEKLLGIKFIELKTTLDEMAKSAIEAGLVKAVEKQ